MISYNTAMVLLGTTLLGTSCGLVGTFVVLRRRSLAGDALAHASLPGVCVAYMILGERNLPFMLLGALCSGLFGVALISLLTRSTRIKEDAAIGIVLSVFFGLGIVLSQYIARNYPSGSKAGLQSYILGSTAALASQDVEILTWLLLLVVAVVVLLFKELQLIVFDPEFGAVQGWPVGVLDLVLMLLVAMTVVAGLPTVGVALTAALLILPGATARFWTERLPRMLVIASGIGALTATVGTMVSSQSRLPAGPVIVLLGTVLFTLSWLFAPKRGLFRKFATRS